MHRTGIVIVICKLTMFKNTILSSDRDMTIKKMVVVCNETKNGTNHNSNFRKKNYKLPQQKNLQSIFNNISFDWQQLLYFLFSSILPSKIIKFPIQFFISYKKERIANNNNSKSIYTTNILKYFMMMMFIFIFYFYFIVDKFYLLNFE